MGALRARAVAAGAAIAGLAIAGCSYPTNTPSGGACIRTLECGPGLVCSQGHCTSDLTMFGMGHPVSLDSGLTDGARADAGDAGPPNDANLPDTGPHDAYINPNNDAYTPANDAWVAPNDAWVAPNDAWVAPNDAWVAPNDAYTPVDAFADDAFVSVDMGVAD